MQQGTSVGAPGEEGSSYPPPFLLPLFLALPSSFPSSSPSLPLPWLSSPFPHPPSPFPILRPRRFSSNSSSQTFFHPSLPSSLSCISSFPSSQLSFPLPPSPLSLSPSPFPIPHAHPLNKTPFPILLSASLSSLFSIFLVPFYTHPLHPFRILHISSSFFLSLSTPTPPPSPIPHSLSPSSYHVPSPFPNPCPPPPFPDPSPPPPRPHFARHLLIRRGVTGPNVV